MVTQTPIVLLYQVKLIHQGRPFLHPVMESILYRELTFDTKTLAQLADGAATVKVYDTEQDFICS